MGRLPQFLNPNGHADGRAVEGRGEDGFSLIEVIVALAILSLGLAAIFETLSNGTRRLVSAEREALAMLQGQSLLAKVGSELPLRVGETTGSFASGEKWRLSTSPYGGPADQTAWLFNAYVLTADVSWREGLRDRHVTLTTMRLGPKASAP